MGELRADWRIRLRQGHEKGPIRGAGVLVDQETVLTCAHVAGDPDALLWVEFPENRALAPVAARVVPGGWLKRPPGGEDIAVLRLESPRPQARPAPLETRLSAGLEVYTTGYAEGFDDGMTLWGRISGTHGELVQLDAVVKAEVVRRGFSGAAVCTAGPASPTRVVGLVVSWRGDLDRPLPEDNRLAFSYVVPLSRIAELSPHIAELTAPHAWHKGLEERLERWFDDADEEPVKITHVPPGSGKDRSLRHLTHRADLVHEGGGKVRNLIDHALPKVPYSAGEYLAYANWLRGQGGPPPGLATARAAGLPSPTLVVRGLDEAPSPDELMAVLARLRMMGFRLLLVFRRDTVPAWTAARDRLRRPALLDHADLLLDRLRRWEEDQRRHRNVVDDDSLGQETDRYEERRSARHVIGGIEEPGQQVEKLRSLIRDLRHDLRHHEPR
ncbi:MAG TPA: serine protease [Streptomyces sp.]|nr:serine protease [Streptomyces sp.]